MKKSSILFGLCFGLLITTYANDKGLNNINTNKNKQENVRTTAKVTSCSRTFTAWKTKSGTCQEESFEVTRSGTCTISAETCQEAANLAVICASLTADHNAETAKNTIEAACNN